MNCVRLFGDGGIYRAIDTDVINCPQLAALEEALRVDQSDRSRDKRIIYIFRKPWLVVMSDGTIASPEEIDHVGIITGIHRMGKYFVARMKYPAQNIDQNGQPYEGQRTTILTKVKNKWTFVDFGDKYSSFSFNGRSLVGITKRGDEVHVTRSRSGAIGTRVVGKAKYGYSRFLVCATAAVMATSVPADERGTRICVNQWSRETGHWSVTFDVDTQVSNQCLVVDHDWLLMADMKTKEPLLFYLRYQGCSVIKVRIDKQLYIADMWGNALFAIVDGEPPAHYTLVQGDFVKSV